MTCNVTRQSDASRSIHTHGLLQLLIAFLEYDMGDVGFVSGAEIYKTSSESGPTKTASEQKKLGSYFSSTQGRKYETKKRDHESVTAEDCYQ